MMHARIIRGKAILLIAAALVFLQLAAPAGASTVPVCTFNSQVSANFDGGGAMISIALLIILTMFIITGITYALSYAFKLDKLARFSRVEIGEIAVTLLIVLIFLGTFSVSNTISGPSAFFPAANHPISSQTFSSACEGLYASSLNLVGPLIIFGVQQEVISLVASINIKIEPNFFGFGVSPFSGLSVISRVLTFVINVGTGFIGLMVGMIVVLYVIYGVFPLFFFIGIVLRTMPWTRAAGGSFLGLFISFYILFPLLLHFLLAANMVAIPTSTSAGVTSSLSAIMSGGSAAFSLNPLNSLSTFASIVDILPAQILSNFIEYIITPAIFTLVAVAISLIIAFDFSETIGSFLGASSLTSSRMLNKVV
ncbi:hypothetical protein M1439_01460 [Candidatus Marsarchaeota archaeon]|jgi:hypothetical protein|nr:hypothetical protein [Candidatus Marsarchaeota archaeon]MCL5092421.1 hypothetical protein [Candidatus Marsarchaeota archaeon]